LIASSADVAVRRRARDVTHFPEDAEPPGLGIGRPVLHGREVAVHEIDAGAVDLEPGAAVRDRPPLPRREHLAGEAERADVIGIDRRAVVEPEVPIRMRARRARRARAAQRHGFHTANLREPLGEVLHQRTNRC
jgi:hypothetical protein